MPCKFRCFQFEIQAGDGYQNQEETNCIPSEKRERRGKLFPKKGKIDYATTTSLLGEQTPFKKVKSEEKFVEIS